MFDTTRTFGHKPFRSLKATGIDPSLTPESAPLKSRSVTIYLPESRMVPSLTALQDRYPDVEIGSYPVSRDGRFGARLVLRSTEDARLAAAGTELEATLRATSAANPPGTEPRRERRVAGRIGSAARGRYFRKPMPGEIRCRIE